MTQLDYATVSADGLPDWVPEAESRIDAGGGPDSIKPCFEKSRHASLYFAKSIARRFTQDDRNQACAQCGAPSIRYITLNWIAIASPNVLEFKMSEQSNAVPFVTHHLLCNQCVVNWDRKSRIPRWILGSSSWIIVGLIFLMMLINVIYRPDGPIYFLWIFLAMILIRVSRFICRKRLTRSLPTPARWVLRKHVRLASPDW